MSRTQTDPSGKRLVGIDLGTTNSAVAWTRSRGPIRIFEVPQLASAAEIARAVTLPSFLYFPSESERQAGLTRLPWNETPEVVAGVFARDHGALAPARQIASAKSWLANPSVDRTAPLLPWGTEEGPRLSPVQASAALLAHLRDAWNLIAYGPGAFHFLPASAWKRSFSGGRLAIVRQAACTPFVRVFELGRER